MDFDLDVDGETIISRFHGIIRKLKIDSMITGKCLFDELFQDKLMCKNAVITVFIHEPPREKQAEIYSYIEYKMSQDGNVKILNDFSKWLTSWAEKDVNELFQKAINENYSYMSDNELFCGSLKSCRFQFNGCECLAMVYLKFS